MRIKVEITRNPRGIYTARPVSARHRKRYARYLERCTDMDPETGTAFFWGNRDLPETIARNRRAMRDLSAGRTAVVLIDSREYGGWLGYDASEVEL